MANFIPSKHNVNEFNKGTQYVNGDVVQAETINNVIESALYSQDTADSAKNTADNALKKINEVVNTTFDPNGNYSGLTVGRAITAGYADSTDFADTAGVAQKATNDINGNSITTQFSSLNSNKVSKSGDKMTGALGLPVISNASISRKSNANSIIADLVSNGVITDRTIISGKTYITADIASGDMTNLPANMNGILFTTTWDGGYQCCQLLLPQAQYVRGVWFRMSVSDTNWGDWHRLLDDRDLSAVLALNAGERPIQTMSLNSISDNYMSNETMWNKVEELTKQVEDLKKLLYPNEEQNNV